MKFLLLIQFVVVGSCQSGTSQDRDDSVPGFPAFWERFKSAIVHGDRLTVEQLTVMPFRDHYNDIYDEEHSLSCNDAAEFLRNFELIFDEYVVLAIKRDNFRGYDNKHSPDGDIIGVDDFLLTVNHPQRPKDLLFRKTDNGYRLVSIHYYE